MVYSISTPEYINIFIQIYKISRCASSSTGLQAVAAQHNYSNQISIVLQRIYNFYLLNIE